MLGINSLLAVSTGAVSESRSILWAVVILVILILLALLAWWLWGSRKTAKDEVLELPSAAQVKAMTCAEGHGVPPMEPSLNAAGETLTRAPAIPLATDNLEIIEGVGPKIAALFRSAGITTFAQLANTEPAKLREMLLAAGLRLADPTTWPEQARLAAEGRMEELQKLQERLKWGR